MNSPKARLDAGKRQVGNKVECESTSQTAYGTSSRYGRSVLKDEIALLVDAVDVRKGVYGASYRAGRLVAGGELDRELAKVQLVNAATELGRPRYEAIRTVESGLAKGALNPRSASVESGRLISQADTRLQIGELLKHALSEVLDKPFTPSDNKVLVALYTEAMRIGKVRFRLSYRQIAEVAGVSSAVAHRSMGRLRHRYVREVEKGSRFRAGHATQWQLVMFSLRNKTAEGRRIEPPSCVIPGIDANAHPLLRPNHDLWHRRANAWRIFTLLHSDGPQTANDICLCLALSPSTVYSNLKHLKDNLCLKSINGLYDSIELDIIQERLAHSVFLAPHADRRRLRHEQERLHHKRFIRARVKTKSQKRETKQQTI